MNQINQQLIEVMWLSSKDLFCNGLKKLFSGFKSGKNKII